MTQSSQQAVNQSGLPQTEPQSIDSDGSLPRVWQFHRKLFHYRVPIWDMLIERSGDVYDLHVFGETENGATVGGPSRPYAHHVDYHRVPGVGLSWLRPALGAIRREKPEIVMIQNDPHSLVSWVAPLIVRRYGGKMVAWAKVASYSRWPRPIQNLAKRLLFPLYDFSVVYGFEAKDELIALGYPAERIFVASNTIDTRRAFERGDEFAERGRRLVQEHGLSDRKLMVCVASMLPKKRHDDLLAAWPAIAERHPDLDLVLAGGGPELDRVRSEAAEVDAARIHVLGRIPEGDDYAWYAVADLSVQCGAVGLGVNQSMSFGIPTVAADEPGPDSEIVRHGETGWRYEKANVDALVEVVDQVLTDAEQRESIAAAGQKLMRDEVTIDNMVQQLDACTRAALDDWSIESGSGS